MYSTDSKRLYIFTMVLKHYGWEPDTRSVDGRSATGNQGGSEVGKSSQVGREVGSLLMSHLICC